MKLVTYNIQYGVGLDGQYDPERIADAVRGADVIALQEVTRNFSGNGAEDLVAALRNALPNYFSTFDPVLDVDAGSSVVDGVAINRRLQFGNMVFSKTPLISTRRIALPRTRTWGRLNLQRGAIEVVVQAPFGPLRVYSVHLNHSIASERIAQINMLRELATQKTYAGGALTGGKAFKLDDTPETSDFVIMGDFNMKPNSPEFLTMTGQRDDYAGLVPTSDHPTCAEVLAGENPSYTLSYIEPGAPENDARLDFAFVSASLAPHVQKTWVDVDAIGSDHRPVWLVLGD
ncbi:MAG: endonuclease/exonuclease/phosphatase family protein [Pikeienuella sp.]